MAENSLIGWTDHTFNFHWGCHKVSEECRFCYIDGIMRRAGRHPFNGPIRTKHWSDPAKWQRQAEREGRRFRIFTCSMSDFFHPGADEWRPDAWTVIRDCPSLNWLMLTKRPELISARLPSDWGEGGYGNVWLGVTCGIASSLHRLEILREIPAAIRFVSAEPLLGPLNLTPYLDGRFHWVITGCESAAKDKRRPMQIDWVRDIDAQCRAAGVAHFFKQRYEKNKLDYDGDLDGETRQDFPN
jgi:protein gp37